jgi:hypothetical protein
LAGGPFKPFFFFLACVGLLTLRFELLFSSLANPACQIVSYFACIIQQSWNLGKNRRKVLAMNTFFARFAIIGAVLVCAQFGFAQGVPCSEAKPTYYSPTPDRAKHLSISRETSGPFEEAKKVKSVLGSNRWFVTVDPVYTKNPPWNTTIFVGQVGSDKSFLTINVSDHGNTLNVKWVSDRLVHINISWGRFSMSDWLIDVGRGIVVYDEMIDIYEEYSCEEDNKKTAP